VSWTPGSSAMAAPEGSAVRREALIVAADSYEDPKLRSLRAPARDAQELARVLGDPEVGDFQVKVSLNEPDHVVRRKLSEFFRDRSRDDLLLLHVSCHGLKDEDGTLYFASSNTAVEHLEATAIPSEFVNRQMTRSRSRRIVLLLDCCFGGAFARGMVHRAGESVALKEEFEGQGRVVLTASRAMEYAFEGDNREGDAQPSIFTSAIVQGLESGEADRDRDSRISVDELYDYVYDRVREATPNQTPSKWVFDVHGDLYVARSPFHEPEPVELPVELRAAMESPFAHVRAGAVEELARLFTAAAAGLSVAARLALMELAEDDSRRVSEAAGRALAEEDAARGPATPAVREPLPAEPARERPSPAALPTPQRERSASAASQVAAAFARDGRWQHGLALAGAALIVLGYFRTVGWATAWFLATHFKDGIWALWSPLEAFGLALLVASGVWASRAAGVPRESGDGLLLGVGLTACAAAIAFVGSSFELAGAGIPTVLGAVAIAGAGVLGLRARRAPEAVVSRPVIAAAAAGAALALSPLVVHVASWDSGLLSGWDWFFYLEVLIAGVAALVALLVLIGVPNGRLHAAGALIGIGALLALHFVAVVVEVANQDGIRGGRLGGPLGVAGALLLVGAGIGFIRAERGVALPATRPLPTA
jgi:hypothetical protein